MNDLVVVLQPDSSQALRLQQILFELGAHSLWVETGEKALQIIETMGPPRLLVIEPALPGSDGFEVLKALRSMKGQGYFPAVVISAVPKMVQTALQLKFILDIADVQPSSATALSLREVLKQHLRAQNDRRFQPLPVKEFEKAKERLTITRLTDVPRPMAAREEPPMPAGWEAAADQYSHHRSKATAPPRDAGGITPAPPPVPAVIPQAPRPTPRDPRQDLEKLRQEVERLLPLISVDLLTGLPNHRAGEEAGRREAGRARRTKRSYAVMTFDLDHFKQYNEKHGRDEGDRVLKTLASVIAHSIRGTDVPVRWSGDRFMVILVETGKTQARKLAGRILRRLSGGEEKVDAKVFMGVADSSAGPEFSSVIQAAESDLQRHRNSPDPAVYIY